VNNLWTPVDKILAGLLDYFFPKFSFLSMTNPIFAQDFSTVAPPRGVSAEMRAVELFRAEFKRALASCVKNHFSVEESFGLIWEETLDEIKISEQAQGLLYDELISWAKRWVK
jgi:hypothetical protein